MTGKFDELLVKRKVVSNAVVCVLMMRYVLEMRHFETGDTQHKRCLPFHLSRLFKL